MESGDWWVNDVLYADVITPVVSVRNISDVLLCSGRLGKVVVTCLSSTTALQKDNNNERLKIKYGYLKVSSLIFLKRGIVYVVRWYMMPCTCSMTIMSCLQHLYKYTGGLHTPGIDYCSVWKTISCQC